jgi:hypothetical protein
MNSTIITLRKWLTTFVQVQFFISLISLPVLVAWGLPLSLMTIVGNLVFGPFLTVFLLCSSLIFFSELLHIPNSFLIWMLEKITALWIWFLKWGSKSWMISFPLSTLTLLFLAALLAFVILQHQQWGKREPSGLFFCIIFITVLGVNKLVGAPDSALITCRKKTVTVTCSNGKLTLQDHGGLGEKVNPTSWIQYTFLSKLTKTFGTTAIKTVFVNRCKLPTLDALSTLCQETTVDEIIFTQPQQISKRSQQHVNKIMKQCKSIKTECKQQIIPPQ